MPSLVSLFFVLLLATQSVANAGRTAGSRSRSAHVHSHRRLHPSAPPPPADDTTPPINISQWQDQTVMFISAHPDDIEAMAGGLVYTLTSTPSLNITVVYVIVTNGDKGCTQSQLFNCSALSSADIAQIRAGEAKTAAAALGVHMVELLNYEDGMVLSYPEQDIREDLTICVRRHRPAVVFTWHREWQLDLQPGDGWDDLGYHPDHQAVGGLAIATAVGPSAGDPYMFPALLTAGLEPFDVSQVYLFTFEGLLLLLLRLSLLLLLLFHPPRTIAAAAAGPHACAASPAARQPRRDGVCSVHIVPTLQSV